jgi:hypothetical protein
VTSTSTTTSVTSSTCTSTTLFPACQHFGAACGGVCSIGQTCQDDGMGGCGCVGPPVPCDMSYPSVCSTGTCPPGQSCHTVVIDPSCGPTICACQ